MLYVKALEGFLKFIFGFPIITRGYYEVEIVCRCCLSLLDMGLAVSSYTRFWVLFPVDNQTKSECLAAGLLDLFLTVEGKHFEPRERFLYVLRLLLLFVHLPCALLIEGNWLWGLLEVSCLSTDHERGYQNGFHFVSAFTTGLAAPSCTSLICAVPPNF
jgi:hypothetical protein